MMTKFPVLFFAVFALCIVAYGQDAFGIFDCADPRCHVWQQTSRLTPIEGIEYQLDSPDLWIDRTECDNTAAAAGWLVANTGEWVEAGVTKGHFLNVGCVAVLSTYYGFNYVIGDLDVYQEYLVSNGRVDPGDDISVKIQKYLTSNVQVYVTTPDVTIPYPQAQLFMNPNNVYHGNFGIEGTVSATDDYSSIPMSKFTGMKIRQNGSWTNLPASASLSQPSVSEGYIGKECRGNSFIAGTVTSLDCNNIATRNQVPTVQNRDIDVATNDRVTVDINAIDTDGDYLTFYLKEHPTKGSLSHTSTTEKIPTTNGTAIRLEYTPASSTPESDTIRYTVTDKRIGHTREGVISIVGPSTQTVPDPVDDLSYTLSGNNITLAWSIPDDGGSNITSFRIERSPDTQRWNLHDTVSETTTSIEHTGYPGYDMYFRIFAKNAHGLSPASNLVNVNIEDPTPPVITITAPAAGSTVTVPDIAVSGWVYEPEGSGIEYVKVYVDGIVPATNPVEVTHISDVTASFESVLTGLDNGNHTIAVESANGDGATATSSVTVTLDAPVQATVDSFAEDFEGMDLSRWHLTTGDDEYWSIRPDPTEPVPGSQPGNKVGGAEDCDDVCSMTMIDVVDLTQMSQPVLSFYRFVATGADVSNNEGIYVHTSSDGGTTWIQLANFTANNAGDDGAWHHHSYVLSNASDSFKVRFEARSSSNNEDAELDDIRIYDGDAGDTTPPSITAPEDVTAEATAVLTPASDVGLGDAVASDDVDPDPAITNDAPESFPLGDTIVTWTATDSAGNAATATQTVTIQDTTLPSITTPPDVTIEASGVLTAVSIGQATASDIADPDPAITNDAPESFPLGDTIVTWTATDSAGNAATATQTVTIQDTTPPRIMAPADHTAEAAGIMTVLSAGDYGTSTVTDVADPSPTITNDAPESFPLGNTTVTWTATDSAGNAATATQTVTIRDTTPPAISGLRDIDVDDPAGRGMAVSYDAPTASDLVDGVVAVSCTHESGSTFAPGFTEVVCTATDGSANSQRDWFVIHVDASDAVLDVSQTVSTGRSTWSVTGPDRVFAGQTFEYTVTLEDGARPREEALAVYSAAPERDLGWHDSDTDCQTVICAGFPEQKHDTYKIASDEDSPYTAMHNKMKKSRSSHTILLQPAADAPAGTQATVGMMDSNNNQVGGIPVTVMPPSTRTITDGDTTWRITGPDRIFPGQTFEYTVTVDGARHQHDALAIYSSSLTVDDFGGFPEGSGCDTAVCTDFPGQRRRTMELDNHAGSAYDVRYHTINAPGSQYTILLRTADDADAAAGGTFRVGLVDGDGSPMGGIRVTIADPVAVTAPYEELVAGLSFEGSLTDATGDNNGTAAAGDVTYVPGRIGRGLQLDGSTNVALAGEADFDFGRTDPFSIAFWLRQDVPVNNSTMIMSKAESFGHTGLYVWIWGGAPNRILLLIHDNSTFINVHTPNHLNMSDGAWHHIAFTYDGSGAKEGLNAYIDGEHRDYGQYRRGLGLAGSTTNDHAFTVRTTTWWDPDRIDSVLDELRVYGAELSARQVRLLHAAGLG